MAGVLVAALLLGLVGLAVHVLWIVALIVIALGLGFAANRRRDRIDVVNRAADRDERADKQDGQSATDMTDDARPDLPARHSWPTAARYGSVPAGPTCQQPIAAGRGRP
ncbi:MAG: hypothetical protein ABWY29_12110 [Blastococcus sp.]